MWPPVVLAPMAGVTDVAYRQLCDEAGAGLCVSEMVTSRGLVERHPKTDTYVAFSGAEQVRSVQLFGVDPGVMHDAVARVVDEDLADHVDLNVGCPVPKVTRRGGGAALPWKRRLFADLVAAAVRGARGQVPVTVKMRLGLDDEHLTYRDAGRTAADAGAAWVALHARTAEQGYSGRARWDRVADLVEALDGVPVLGNGDVWEADDALRLVAETGCAGVVVGRGCLGRPWLFAELAAAFDGRPPPPRPSLGQVAAYLRRHAALQVALRGEEAGVVQMRKHMAWYLTGFVVGRDVRQALGLVSSLAELDDLLGRLDAAQAVPARTCSAGRGGARTRRSGWCCPTAGSTTATAASPTPRAESDVSGGLAGTSGRSAETCSRRGDACRQGDCPDGQEDEADEGDHPDVAPAPTLVAQPRGSSPEPRTARRVCSARTASRAARSVAVLHADEVPPEQGHGDTQPEERRRQQAVGVVPAVKTCRSRQQGQAGHQEVLRAGPVEPDLEAVLLHQHRQEAEVRPRRRPGPASAQHPGDPASR